MSSPQLKNIEKAEFAARLAEACGTREPAQISRLLGISYQAAKNYLEEGRFPKAEILIAIAECTGCSIYWLLTGKGKKFLDFSMQESAPLPTGQDEAFVRRVCVEVINETFGEQPRVVVLPPASLREEKVADEQPVSSELTVDRR
jgi:transcriptional regulator with XRE-family HTH domain